MTVDTSPTTRSAQRPRPLLALSLPELWAFLAVALPVLAALIAPLSTVDLAYQVRAGRLMLEGGEILRTDPFTFTAAGQPWLNQQWGAQVILGGIHEVGGWALVAALRALLVGVLFWLVYRACREAGAGQRASAGLTLAAFGVSAVALGLRPQLIGMVLFALTIWLVGRRRRDPRLLWFVPIIVVAWANIHGSFFLGPAVLGFAWLQDRWERVAGTDRTLLVALVSVVAATLNPWALGVWGYAIGLSVDPTIRRLLTEWQVTTPFSLPGAVFYLSVAGAIVGLLLRRPRPLPWPSLLWLGVLVAIGVFAQRGIIWWAIGGPSVLAAILFAVPTADRPVSAGMQVERRSVVNGILAIAIVVGGILALPWWRAAAPSEGPLPLLTDAPTGITRALQAHVTPADRIFNLQAWGSWLEFATPDAPVFVDSRIEILPRKVWDEYLAVSAGEPGWQSVLDRWGVTVVVAAAPGQDGLIAQMRASPDWRQLEEVDAGVVFVRK